MKKEKLSANILFSGIGCQERGFQNSNLFDLEVLNISDICKESVLSYAAIHCGLTNEMVEIYPDYPSREEMAKELTEINLGYEPEKDKYFDWAKLVKRKNKDLEKYWLANKLSHNLGDISKIEELPYADLWTCSFPCFTGDTLVLTKEYGYMPIKDIKKGMSVLTHDNTYRTVTKSMLTGKKNIYEINAMCFDKLQCTENHRFFVKTRHRVNTHIKGKAVTYRYFDEPIWKECKDLSKDDYLGYAINQNSIIPKWEDSSETKVKISSLMNNRDFWWVIGRYIADGYRQTSKTGNRITLCCGKSKAPLKLIEKYSNNCKLNYCISNERTCLKYHICSNELYKFVSQFGDKACGKFIPPFVFDMPIDLCKAFLEGYWSGDGCFTQGRYKATSVSKNLIYGIGQLIAKVYHRPFSIYFTKRKSTTVIEGRTVNQKDSYSVAFNRETSKQDKAFYEEGYIWFPIKEISDTYTQKDVYDITVETNHSFTANGAIVHNCTDISVAGKMKGLSPDTSTRSSLLWENIRLLKKARDNNISPKYIMFENVENLVSKRFIADFNNLLEVLDELGFNSYWKVLNAKECGIPQNRERVFVICIRKDIDKHTFGFPSPFDNGLRLKDILEEVVDEKYYLSDDKVEKFKKNFNIVQFNTSKVSNREYKIGNVYNPKYTGGNYAGNVYDKRGISPTLLQMQGGGRQPHIITSEGAIGIDKSINNTQMIEYANCITAREDRGVSNRKSEGTAIMEIHNDIRIRKLTPRECYVLMGLTFEDCDKAAEIGVANTHLYKQAGNGIVTNCCELIAEHLYKAQYDNTYVCTDEKMINFTNPQPE